MQSVCAVDFFSMRGLMTMNLDFLRDVKVDAPAKVILRPAPELVAAVTAAEAALAEHRASGGEFNGLTPALL
jgi:hypothetical protein